MRSFRSQSDHVQRRSQSSASPAPTRAAQLKRALIGQPLDVQMAMLGPENPPANVQDTAAAGVRSGGGGALPHLDAIQRSFGHHDVSGVQAHSGGQAAEASKAIGAEAYATGNDVAFASTPSLHTAAHEAAHVVQQRAGVQLAGGVGAAGDPYEHHADRVADRVVAGESAQGLLDQMAPATGGASGAAGGPVQRKEMQWPIT
jgi:hypothetical protein